MEKRCGKCRGLTIYNNFHMRYVTCSFFYHLKPIYSKNAPVIVNAMPLEDCPKPITWKEWMNTERKPSTHNK